MTYVLYVIFIFLCLNVSLISISLPLYSLFCLSMSQLFVFALFIYFCLFFSYVLLYLKSSCFDLLSFVRARVLYLMHSSLPTVHTNVHLFCADADVIKNIRISQLCYAKITHSDWLKTVRNTLIIWKIQFRIGHVNYQSCSNCLNELAYR